MDLSELKFDSNHMQKSRGREALDGLRLVLLSAVVYMGLTVHMVLSLLVPSYAPVSQSTLAGLLSVLLAFGAFGAGAYGTYLVLDALGWAKYISALIIASFLVPYFRLLSLLFVLAMGIDLVSRSGFRLTLFGPARLATPPPEA